MDVVPFITYIAIGLLVGAGFCAVKIRGITNSIIPFIEPLTYIILAGFLVALGFTPMADELKYQLAFAFILGYLIGYLLIGHVTIIWVDSHDLEHGTQKIEPVVYYRHGDDPQLYVQPQKFKDVCKRVFFGVECPLEMQMNPGTSLQRKRDITFQGLFIKQNAQTVTMQKHEVKEFTVDKFRFGTYKISRRGVNRYGDDSIIGKPRYLLHFKAYAHIYLPAPYNTDAPYDFILKTELYKVAIERWQEGEVRSIRSDVEKQMTLIHGGAVVLSNLKELNISDPLLSAVRDKINTDLRIEDSAREQRMEEERRRTSAEAVDNASERV